MTDLDLGVRLFLQLGVILLACRLFGWLGRFFGQPQVVSEMVAGVILGPSVLALLAPQIQTWIFPQHLALASGETIRHPSMQILFAMSQVGLALYMFVVGLDFNHSFLEKRTRSAVFVSVAGIVAPFLLGGLVAFPLHAHGGFFGTSIGPWQAAIFVGAAMSITAFPMLARIIYERGLTNTSLGNLALAAAATDDAVAWSLLAVVLAITKGAGSIAVVAIGGGLTFTVFTLTLGRRIYAKLGERSEREGDVGASLFLSTLTIVVVAGWFTESIGIYAVFGAFLTGVAMPRGLLAEKLKARIEPLVGGLLVPLFFVFSGLNTRITLINTPSLLTVALLVIFVAVVAKGGACIVAARAVGEPWRDALGIGTLMNARGMMELIILNFGLQAGVISPTLFSIMVLMAITTTLMTTPIFRRVYERHISVEDIPQAAVRASVR